MKEVKEKFGIEAGDFITPKKAITITTISMVIWFITGGSYALLKLLFAEIDYLTYTFIASFILSILFSIYVVSKLVRKTDLVMKIIIGALNATLIYTSVNGAQATYGFLNPKDSSPPKTENMGFLIPFLDPRPWIPDKFLMAENETLAKDKMILLLENEDLSRQNGLLQTRIDLLKDSIHINPDRTRNDNFLLRDSIAMLANNLAGCQKQNEELSRQLKNLLGESDNSRTGAQQESLRNLERLNATCEKNNALLTRQLESLRGRIQQFNARQDQWRQRTTANVSNNPDNNMARIQEIAGSVKRNVNSLMNDNTYYDFLFLTPIK